MVAISIVFEEGDTQEGQNLAHRLEQVGHDVRMKCVSRFPIADPLAALFASMRIHNDVVLILISQLSPQTMWVLQELLITRQIIDSDERVCLFLGVFMKDVVIPSWMPRKTYIDTRNLVSVEQAQAELHTLMQHQIQL